MKKKIFLLIAAIAVLSVYSSCDKDEFIKTPINFFAFKDARTIAIYDEGLVEIGEQSIKVDLQTQYPLDLPYVGQEFGPAEGETLERKIHITDLFDENIGTDYRSSKDAIITEFHFTGYPEYTVRIVGLNLNKDDKVFICTEVLTLKCEVTTLEKEENPFRQEVRLDFTLTSEKGIQIATDTKTFELKEVDLSNVEL